MPNYRWLSWFSTKGNPHIHNHMLRNQMAAKRKMSRSPTEWWWRTSPGKRPWKRKLRLSSAVPAINLATLPTSVPRKDALYAANLVIFREIAQTLKATQNQQIVDPG